MEINGTQGDDTLLGTDQADLIRGRGGSDTINAGGGNDFIDAGAGDDVIYGSDGDDDLVAGEGNDTLTGNAGADEFRLEGSLVTGTDTDVITDLNFAEGDRVVLYRFAPGTFDDSDGEGAETAICNDLDITNVAVGSPAYGAGVVIDSYADIAEMIQFGKNLTATQKAGTDTLVLTMASGNGGTQVIEIHNAWAQYLAAGNQAPTTVNDAAAVVEEGLASGNVLANDTDAACDSFTLTSVQFGANPAQAAPANNSPVVVNGVYGVLTISANGAYSYVANTAAANALSQGQLVSEVFSYTVTDTGGLQSTATLTVNVTGVNDAPVAQNIAGVANENGPAVTLTPLFTDVDANDTHTITLDTTGVKGKVVQLPNGTFTYDANGKFESLGAGQTATETFSYTVTDSAGAAVTKSVTVTVNGQNDGPVALADINGVDRKGCLTVSAAKGVLSNDTDVDNGATETVSAVNGSAANVGKSIAGTYGTLVLKSDGSYTYQANNKSSTDFVLGQDIFTYTVSDGKGGTSTTTLTISVIDKGDDYDRGTDGDDCMWNFLSKDVLDGGNGNDTLYGGLFHDTLIGGTGNDTLIGGFGADTFVFNPGFGKDTIADYGWGNDKLQFNKAVFSSFASVKANATQVGADVIIDAGGGNQIKLLWTNLSSLQANDMLFV